MNGGSGLLLRQRDLLVPLRAAVAAGTPIAVLVIRVPRFSQVAWRDGKRAGRRLEQSIARAFADAASRVVREGDLLTHDRESDWFALAMLAPARDGSPSRRYDARAALERIAATMSLVTGEFLETGWWIVEAIEDVEHFEGTIERALERGARERERFEFLAAVGHELRTPLTSIRGYLETLLEGGVDPVTARRFLEIARSEALRLGRLVDGMLEFSLLDLAAGIRAGIADLGSVVRGAVESLAPVAAAAGIALHARVESETVVRIDGDACMHALLNLLENAIKYGRCGGGVLVSLERQAAFVCINVDDDGPGIAPEDRERIFAHRARGAGAGDQRGSGIGLAIVRTIVERAGGRVHVTESPLGGARFVLSLPGIEAESTAGLS